MRHLLLTLAGLAALALAACTSPADTLEEAAAAAEAGASPAARAVDKVLPVAEQHRPLRACLLVAGFGQVAAEKAGRGLADGDVVLGHLTRLAFAADRSRAADPFWRNTAMARATLDFGAAAIDIGKEKVVDYLARGLSIETVLFGARQLGVDAVMIPAVAADVRLMLASLAGAALSADDLWTVCQATIAANIRRLGG